MTGLAGSSHGSSATGECREAHPARRRGDHRQFNHLVKRGVVTVPGKPSDELAPGTLNNILKQAGLK